MRTLLKPAPHTNVYIGQLEQRGGLLGAAVEGVHDAAGGKVVRMPAQRRQRVWRGGPAVQERRQPGAPDQLELPLEAAQLRVPLAELQPGAGLS